MKKLERFILRDILSDGPAGTVYKAEEILPGDNRRLVALKVLPQLEGVLTGESPAEERFFAEVKVLAQLAVHPHLVTLYAMGLSDGYPWLAMEYAPLTLRQKMDENHGAAAAPAEVLRLLEQAAMGLSAMHAVKPPLIHQDLKPANLLIDGAGNFKITDFSLATVTAGNRTQPQATVRYAPPEMLDSQHGRIGPWTDLYALGQVAYEYALGAKVHRLQFPAVFEGNSSKEPPPQKWMMWHASLDTRPMPAAKVAADFPDTLSDVISRLMAKRLTERYASAAELLSDLSVIRNEMQGTGHAASGPLEFDLTGDNMAEGPPSAGANRARTPIALESSTGQPGPRSGTAGSSTASSVPVTPLPATSSAGPFAKYWVRMRGKVSGPFDLGTLQRQLKQGHISRLHQVSADQVTWKQASEIEGLYGPAIV